MCFADACYNLYNGFTGLKPMVWLIEKKICHHIFDFGFRRVKVPISGVEAEPFERVNLISWNGPALMGELAA